MKKNILNIFILLLTSVAIFSCSAKLEPEQPPILGLTSAGAYTIVVSGAVSDIDSNFPIGKANIVMEAVETLKNNKTQSFQTKSETDMFGRYTLKLSGFSGPISVTIRAYDANGEYEAEQHKIPSVTWDSEYNMNGKTFFVNDCDFYLKKKVL